MEFCEANLFCSSPKLQEKQKWKFEILNAMTRGCIDIWSLHFLLVTFTGFCSLRFDPLPPSKGDEMGKAGHWWETTWKTKT
jgi:hypothetical protein